MFDYQPGCFREQQLHRAALIGAAGEALIERFDAGPDLRAKHGEATSCHRQLDRSARAGVCDGACMSSVACAAD